MKTTLYRKWIKHVCREFPKHPLLKEPDGRLRLALRIWNYAKDHPTSSNWVTAMAREFKQKHKR